MRKCTSPASPSQPPTENSLRERALALGLTATVLHPGTGLGRVALARWLSNDYPHLTADAIAAIAGHVHAAEARHLMLSAAIAGERGRGQTAARLLALAREAGADG